MKSDTRTFYEAAVHGAVARIYDHLDEALDLEGLARLAALSPLHFHRIFRGMIGETPLELHRRLRLERAAHQLLSGDQAVTRIAFDAGYETHESFTRAFSERYAKPPISFRLNASEGRACVIEPRWQLAARSGIHFDPHNRPDPNFDWQQGEMLMHVELKELPALRLGALRHVGPYMNIGDTFSRVGKIIAPLDLAGKPGVQMVALFYDDPEVTPASELKSDAAFSLPEGVPLPQGLTEMHIAAGRYAMTTFVGHYRGLPDAWAKFMGGWLPRSGHRVVKGAPSFEIYRNTPDRTAPDELVTELYLPLA